MFVQPRANLLISGKEFKKKEGVRLNAGWMEELSAVTR